MEDRQRQARLERLKGSVSSDYDTLDYRHPEMYRRPIPEATGAVIEWFCAFSQRDGAGMAQFMHFPFTHVEENGLITIDRAEDILRKPPPFFDLKAIAAGDYDTLDGISTPIYRPAEVGFFLSFSRYHRGGKRALRGEAFLAVRRDDDGRWGVALASTMLKPAAEGEMVYPETLESARRVMHLYMYAYGVRDQALLDRLGWPHGNIDFDRFARMAGSRLGGYHDTIAPGIDIPQHSATKAHCLATFVRRQRDGSPITVNRGLYIVAKQQGEWRWLIGGAFAREHDFSND